jgi:hypothetical protein
MLPPRTATPSTSHHPRFGCMPAIVACIAAARAQLQTARANQCLCSAAEHNCNPPGPAVACSSVQIAPCCDKSLTTITLAVVACAHLCSLPTAPWLTAISRARILGCVRVMEIKTRAALHETSVTHLTITLVLSKLTTHPTAHVHAPVPTQGASVHWDLLPMGRRDTRRAVRRPCDSAGTSLLR